MSAYLLAFAIGDFDVISASTAQNVAVRVFFPPCTFTSHLSDVGYSPSSLRFCLDTAVHAMDFFQQHLAEPYPLAHLQVVLSLNFAAGAMENFGLIVSRGEYMVVDAQSDDDTRRRVSYVISHEIAHQWFGNVVTNADWSDLYVQEGLATFLGYRCVDTVFPALQSSLHFRMGDVTAYYAYDVFNYSTPIKPQGLSGLEAVNSFSPVSYTKVCFGDWRYR